MAKGWTRVLVLPVDAPTAGADDIALLLAAPAPGAAYEGLNLPLVADLEALPDVDGSGWSVRRFVEVCGLARPPCPAGARSRLRGANTPAERQDLLAELTELERGRVPGGA